MTRLIEHAGLRTMSVDQTLLLADLDREPRGNAGSAFKGRPRVSLGEPNAASGLAFAIGGVGFDDNDALSLVLYADQPIAGEGEKNPDRRVRPIATLAVTMGTKTETVWIDGKPQTVRWADNIVVTMGSYATYLFARYSLADLASFNDADGIAELLIPQLPHVSAVVVDGTIASGTKTAVIDARRAS